MMYKVNEEETSRQRAELKGYVVDRLREIADLVEQDRFDDVRGMTYTTVDETAEQVAFIDFLEGISDDHHFSYSDRGLSMGDVLYLLGEGGLKIFDDE